MKRWIIRIAIALVVLALIAGGIIWYILPRADLEFDVAMRDDIHLRTYIFTPEGEGPKPTILMRTPYPPRLMMTLLNPSRYTEAGYVFAMQSCRGTNKSEGEFYPFSHALVDGEDTLNWLVNQEFCNGTIGLTGVSAMGITSLFTASLQHEAVKAAYVAMAPESSFSESSFIAGVFLKAQVEEWMRLQEAEHITPTIQSRPVMDEEWATADIITYRPTINIPIYHVGGWFDIFQNGVIENFSYLQSNGVGLAQGNQKLRIGAFGHLPLEGDLKHPPTEAPVNPIVSEDEIAWFDHWLKGEENGIAADAPVEVYLMASARADNPSPKNRAIQFSQWPPPATDTRHYLHPDRRLSTDPPTETDASTEYTFDPNDPVPTIGGANLFLPRGPKDQREIPDRQDYLRFETEPLQEDITIAGKVTAELYVTTDAPDTDFMAKLIDIYPDGYEALLLDAPVRARYRNGRNPEDVAMMTPGEPTKLTIDLWNTANIFEAGHRIAVHITSSNYPRFEVNTNNGAAPNDTTTPPRTATNTILHNAQHPSAIILPILTQPEDLPSHE